MSEVDEKLLDKQITKCIQDGYFEGLKDLIELPDDIIRQIVINTLEQNGRVEKFPPHILKEILIARDKKVLGLKQYDISTVKAEDLDLDDEMSMYNGEIQEQGEITVVRGKNKEGKDTVLYYYLDDWATRQQRVFNEHGDIESMYRHVMFRDGRLEYIDNALVAYQYDNEGRKKAALYQDDISGMIYYEYDKAGDVSISIKKEVIMQRIKEDGFTYTIADGYIEPKDNGYTYKSMPDTSNLTPNDMKRGVYGNIAQDKRLTVLSGMDEARKEEVLSILTAVEPIFQSLSTDVQRNEQDARKRMEKVVTWFTGFAKRLKIDPKLATQDSSVISTMKSAVHKTIGKTANEQKDLSTPAKDEKIYEGEGYGDN